MHGKPYTLHIVHTALYMLLMCSAVYILWRVARCVASHMHAEAAYRVCGHANYLVAIVLPAAGEITGERQCRCTVVSELR